jgi:hypothetical protein
MGGSERREWRGRSPRYSTTFCFARIRQLLFFVITIVNKNETVLNSIHNFRPLSVFIL